MAQKEISMDTFSAAKSVAAKIAYYQECSAMFNKLIDNQLKLIDTSKREELAIQERRQTIERALKLIESTNQNFETLYESASDTVPTLRRLEHVVSESQPSSADMTKKFDKYKNDQSRILKQYEKSHRYQEVLEKEVTIRELDDLITARKGEIKKVEDELVSLSSRAQD